MPQNNILLEARLLETWYIRVRSSCNEQNPCSVKSADFHWKPDKNWWIWSREHITNLQVAPHQKSYEVAKHCMFGAGVGLHNFLDLGWIVSTTQNRTVLTWAWLQIRYRAHLISIDIIGSVLLFLLYFFSPNFYWTLWNLRMYPPTIAFVTIPLVLV